MLALLTKRTTTQAALPCAHVQSTIASRIAARTMSRISTSSLSPLLSTAEVQNLLDSDPTQVKLVDASWYLDKARNARDEFKHARLPGAVFFDIEQIADKTSTLPHMLPTVDTFETAMKYLGIRNDHTIVVYGGKNCFSVARCWWTFQFFGHTNVHIMNGGITKWTQEQRKVVSGDIAQTVSDGSSYEADPQHDLVVSWEQVLAKLNSDTQIVDARGPGRFNGTDPEPRPGMRGGHMPGAINVPFGMIVSANDYSVFRDIDEIKKAFADANVKMDATSPIITTCGSGVTAAVLTFGLHLLGKPLNKAPVYDGSWSEWGMREDLPIAK